MVLPLSRSNYIGYDNKPHNAWKGYYYAQALLEKSSLQRGGNVPFYRGPVLQRGYGLESIFRNVARSVKPSLKEIGKSALTTGLEVLQDMAKGENIKTAAKKRLKESSLAFLDNTVSRIPPRRSIKGITNKQITISSSKPKKCKHHSGEFNDTIFSKLKKERNWKMAKPVHKVLMIAVLRVSIFSYFLLLNRVFKKASLSIIIQSRQSQMVDQWSLTLSHLGGGGFHP